MTGQRRYRSWLAVPMLAAVSLAALSSEPLRDHLWKHRLLLVFSPRAEEPRVTRMLDALTALECEVRDRELVTGLLVARGPSRLGETALSSRDVRSIRETFQVDDHAFAVILIGKDGGEKLRESQVPDMADVFALIDGMPMRRREMAERRSPCASAREPQGRPLSWSADPSMTKRSGPAQQKTRSRSPTHARARSASTTR